ncbi:MAG: class C sortase, partial [Ruminococcus sp.]|nr:class C sortase [Ruminococcus sp.]
VSVEVERYRANRVAEQFDEIADNVIDEKDKKTENSPDAPVYVYKKDIERLKKDSIAYNKKIVNNQFTPFTSDFTKSALNLSDYGIRDNIFGYISAPSINLRLPIYLGANNTVMNYGAAHLSNTSLPVNQNNTNCAIAGHTGYFGRVFFDNLQRLNVGESVSVRNYWQTINYRVVEKKTVTANKTTDLVISPEKRLLTLITCIKNDKGDFDRYLVICEQV